MVEREVREAGAEEWLAARILKILAEGAVSTSETDIRRADAVVGLATALWNDEIATAVERFFYASATADRNGHVRALGYSQGASIALEVMLAAGEPEDVVKRFAALPWEHDTIWKRSEGRSLYLNGGYVQFLVRHGWHPHWLAWELYRQKRLIYQAGAWHDAMPEQLSTTLWNAFDRREFIRFTELYRRLDAADERWSGPALFGSGSLAGLHAYVAENAGLVETALPVVLCTYAHNDSLLVTLITRFETESLGDALAHVAMDHPEGGIGDVARSLLTILAREILDVPENWTTWSATLPRPTIGRSEEKSSRTWLGEGLPEQILFEAFATSAADFARTMQASFASNERSLTGALLTLLAERTRGASRVIRAWAHARGRPVRVRLSWTDHEPFNLEGDTGADIGLVLQVRDRGRLTMERACLIQAKKARVQEGKPGSSWVIDRQQLDHLAAFGDGGLYWLYDISDGVRVLPARLAAAFLHEQSAANPSLNRASILTSTVSLGEFLLHGFIAGRIGEISADALKKAHAYGRQGVGPNFLVTMEFDLGEEQG